MPTSAERQDAPLRKLSAAVLVALVAEIALLAWLGWAAS